MLLEELLENLLEEVNKQLIVYMPLMILCMLKLNELKKMLKEQVLFFVLQLLEIVLVIQKYLNILNVNALECYLPKFQFSVSGIRFSKNEKVMETPSFKEDHISQIPALQMLGEFWLYVYNKPKFPQ